MIHARRKDARLAGGSEGWRVEGGGCSGLYSPGGTERGGATDDDDVVRS